MGIFSGLAKFFTSAGSQVTHTDNMWKYESDKRVIRFGNKFYQAAKKYGISESDALDVYYHGFVIDHGKMVRKYNGYEIGIFYFIAGDSGATVITYTWKKDRL